MLSWVNCSQRNATLCSAYPVISARVKTTVLNKFYIAWRQRVLPSQLAWLPQYTVHCNQPDFVAATELFCRVCAKYTFQLSANTGLLWPMPPQRTNCSNNFTFKSGCSLAVGTSLLVAAKSGGHFSSDCKLSWVAILSLWNLGSILSQ